ncbi:primary-amine oxidase [Tsukamurella soli]|uniref:Amine oxidase n=1 Tax=Tsukamurella soli TaxID=644556 RepID=A0ABP8J356_9ACTN
MSLEVTHPTDGLTPGEISRVREVLDGAGLLGPTVRFAQQLLCEPPKDYLAAWRPGAPIERRISTILLDTATGRSTDAVVALPAGTVESTTAVPSDVAPYGQPPYLFEEYDRVDAIVKADPQWRESMARRGFGEETIALAFCAPLAPGYFGRPDEIGRRAIRSLTFLRDTPDDSPWAHPVEGLVVTIDLTFGEVLRVVDERIVDVPAEHGNYDAAAVGPARTSLKPIEITQPEGPSFTVDGSEVRWENWTLRVGFSMREGLVLNGIGFDDGTGTRPVLHRASVPEMVVPYGDTTETRYWISYFDAGEYHLGKNANSLALGCDCVGLIHYFDAHLAGDDGNPVTIPQAVCMHEEDYGILWKHTEPGRPSRSRRSRRLVISYFATIGNYDYGFFWYFYLDGTIQLEAKATGIVFCGAEEPGTEHPHSAEIAPGLFAPVHQHLFCARLDAAVDGGANYVDEVDLVRIPTGPDNPHGNAFTYRKTRVTEPGGRMADNLMGRTWHIGSAERTNRLGKPTEYQLIPQGTPVLLAADDAPVAARAAFATKHLWVTGYGRDEIFPAGIAVNQHSGGAGLPTYVAAPGEGSAGAAAGPRQVDGADIVVWHVFGPTHIPRPEDWPVMPVDYSGFLLKPYGFLDRNPALDLPDTSSPH